MKVLSLFSGVGGFDLGLEAAGMETIYQCEWDKHATSILNRHWPEVPKWGDITTLTATEILRHGQNPDVVAWGSPCQDLSVAGKRAGLSGERSGLFHEGIRLIKELRKETNNEYPRISIWENVAGALSSNGGADFGAVIDEMAEAGALVIEWAVLDAQHFGVPQRRRRVFVVAVFDPAIAQRCPDPVLPVGESVRGDTKKGKPKGKATPSEVATSIGNGGEIANTISASLYHHGSVVNQDANNGHVVVESPILIDRAAFNQGVNAQYNTHISDDPIVPSLVAKGPHAVLDTQPFVKSRRAQTSDDDETWIPGEVNPTLNQFDVGDTRATTAIVEPMLAFDTQFGSNANVFEDTAPTLESSQQSPSVAYSIQGTMIGRQDHNGPGGKGYRLEGDPMYTLTSTDVHAVVQENSVLAPSLTASNDPSRSPQSSEVTQQVQAVYAAQMAVRRLTPLECERLMGWPDDHTRWKADGTEQADTHRYKQCGNGVASPVAQWIAQHLLNI
jgi:DNA (cytosine-5)-methyltransferase 1